MKLCEIAFDERHDCKKCGLRHLYPDGKNCPDVHDRDEADQKIYGLIYALENATKTLQHMNACLDN